MATLGGKRLRRATARSAMNETYEGWPELAKAVNCAGRKLRGQCGNTIPRRAIVKDVARAGRWKEGGVLPSDYCYNRKNKGLSNRWNVFLWHSVGLYEYVGPKYHYTGLIIEEPRDGK